jgi:sterol desaturase/sphingolipid hydroxylase (fatty acid hydroxylase superfamily)
MEALHALHLGSIALNVLQLGIWLVLLTAVFVPLERLFALHRQKVLRKAIGNDVAYYFLSSLAPKLLLVLPLSGLAWLTHRTGPLGFYEWIAALPFGARFVAALLIGELGAYWGHRWSHEIPLLWRFHAVHHSAEEVDWLVHTRAHPVDMFFTRLCAYVPMYLLGLAQPTGNGMDLAPYLVTVVSTVWGFYIHSNLKWRLGWLEWVVASPAFHHWHHTNDGPEFLNKNYAPLLPCVDLFFGTLYLPKRQWPGKYGTDTAVAAGLVEQLVEPFIGQAKAGEPERHLTHV